VRERPPYEELIAEIAVGRKYGVSDNAIRKWVRAYEAEARRPVESSERSGSDFRPEVSLRGFRH
jgi:transposase-like protein